MLECECSTQNRLLLVACVAQSFRQLFTSMLYFPSLHGIAAVSPWKVHCTNLMYPPPILSLRPPFCITIWTIVVKSNSQINGKGRFLTHCSSETSEWISRKHKIYNYVGGLTFRVALRQSGWSRRTRYVTCIGFLRDLFTLFLRLRPIRTTVYRVFINLVYGCTLAKPHTLNW